MGLGAGGAVTNMHEGFICTPFYPPHQFIEAIIVTEAGERLINEDVYHGRLGSAILERQGGVLLPDYRQPAFPRTGKTTNGRLPGQGHRRDYRGASRGLDTLPTGEVLTADKKIVPGLYSAGRNSAGLPRCASGYASGMSIGDATFFGRLAGHSAARRQGE